MEVLGVDCKVYSDTWRCPLVSAESGASDGIRTSAYAIGSSRSWEAQEHPSNCVCVTGCSVRICQRQRKRGQDFAELMGWALCARRRNNMKQTIGTFQDLESCGLRMRITCCISADSSPAECDGGKFTGWIQVIRLALMVKRTNSVSDLVGGSSPRIANVS
jgi:hypothetical protein